MPTSIIFANTAYASNAQAALVRGPGPGYYHQDDLTGPARSEVKAYLEQTNVDCEFEKAGQCNLNALTDSLNILYIDEAGSRGAYALAFIHYAPDTGNTGDLQLGLWRRAYNGGYRFIANGEGLSLDSARVVGLEGETIVLSGFALGPKDANCCLTDPSIYRVSFANGKLSVALKKSIPVDGISVLTRGPKPPSAFDSGLANIHSVVAQSSGTTTAPLVNQLYVAINRAIGSYFRVRPFRGVSRANVDFMVSGNGRIYALHFNEVPPVAAKVGIIRVLSRLDASAMNIPIGQKFRMGFSFNKPAPSKTSSLQRVGN